VARAAGDVVVAEASVRVCFEFSRVEQIDDLVLRPIRNGGAVLVAERPRRSVHQYLAGRIRRWHFLFSDPLQARRNVGAAVNHLAEQRLEARIGDGRRHYTWVVSRRNSSTASPKIRSWPSSPSM
jgi:hypothetical protein